MADTACDQANITVIMNIDETGWLAGCRVGNIKKSVSFVLHCAVVRSHSVTLIQFISVSLNGRTLCHATNIVENLDSLLIIIITIVMMMMVMHKHIHCNLELH